MKNIRIGKDIALKWTVTVDGVSRDLSVLDLRLFLHNETAGSAVELAFTTNVDVLRAEVLGRDQRNTGVYRLTLWLNKDKIGQSVLDESTAFRLVARTEMEGGEDDNNLETESVELSGNLTTDGYNDYSELSGRVEVLEQQMPVSLDAESSPNTAWLMNKNSEAVIEIGGATMQRNGFMTMNHVDELANATQKNTEQDARLSAIEKDMPNKATKEEVYDYALNRTQYHEDKVFVEQVNGEYAAINAATSERAGVMSAADKTKLDKMVVIPSVFESAVLTEAEIAALVASAQFQTPVLFNFQTPMSVTRANGIVTVCYLDYYGVQLKFVQTSYDESTYQMTERVDRVISFVS